MAWFNCGVILFKNRSWSEGIKFWQIVHESKKSFSKFVIPILFNLAIAHFLSGHSEKSLDLCQDLVRAVCINLCEEENFLEKDQKDLVGFIKREDLIKNIYVLLD
jgi:hypothetical protein